MCSSFDNAAFVSRSLVPLWNYWGINNGNEYWYDRFFFPSFFSKLLLIFHSFSRSIRTFVDLLVFVDSPIHKLWIHSPINVSTYLSIYLFNSSIFPLFHSILHSFTRLSTVIQALINTFIGPCSFWLIYTIIHKCPNWPLDTSIRTLIHTLIHSSINSIIRPLIQLLNVKFSHPFTTKSFHSWTYSTTHSFIHSPTHFPQPFIHLLIHPIVRLSNLFIHPIMLS